MRIYNRYRDTEKDISVLKGKILKSIKIDKNKEDKIFFETTDGNSYIMLHEQDCCECVYIEDICGNLNNLLDYEILMAEKETNSDGEPLSRYDESFTWTFYKLATKNGYVTIRWYGESNGYYCEEVDFLEIKEENE